MARIVGITGISGGVAIRKIDKETKVQRCQRPLMVTDPGLMD